MSQKKNRKTNPKKFTKQQLQLKAIVQALGLDELSDDISALIDLDPYIDDLLKSDLLKDVARARLQGIAERVLDGLKQRPRIPLQ